MASRHLPIALPSLSPEGDDWMPIVAGGSAASSTLIIGTDPGMGREQRPCANWLELSARVR
jgi:hypothetical protein